MLIGLTRVIAASQTRLLAGNQIVITETRLAQGRAGRMVTRLVQGRAGTMEGVTALYNTNVLYAKKNTPVLDALF